jgi:hypothetical protein
MIIKWKGKHKNSVDSRLKFMSPGALALRATATAAGTRYVPALTLETKNYRARERAREKLSPTSGSSSRQSILEIKCPV